MGGIAVHSRVYRDVVRIQVEIDTTSDGTSAWVRDFDSNDAGDILKLLLQLAPGEVAKIRDFVTHTVNFGEAHVIIPLTCPLFLVQS